MKIPKRVHFMGIGGSGMSAVAQIAHHQGFQITGCDLQTNTPYLHKITALNIPVSTGHDSQHLLDSDILVVTPAVFYQSNNHPEFTNASKEHLPVMKWQEFMSTYLHSDKFLICIAGTHGKSTTTAWIGHLLENANLDPTVEIGATDNSWHNNVRIGNGKYFVSEADEFHNNFASYKPNAIILTNLEMDHPEYFVTEEKLYETYKNFVQNLQPPYLFIYNSDSSGCLKLIKQLQSLDPELNAIPYSLSEFPTNINLHIPGEHNKSNAMAVIKLAHFLELPEKDITNTLTSFTGVGRRLELLGEKNNIKVYDDYANHPSSFSASISALKELYPQSNLWAVIEPHTFSRLRTLLPELPAAVYKAEHIIISKIFASRETDPGDFTGQDIINALKHPDAKYIPEFPNIVDFLVQESHPNDVILVMGSGNSYQLSRQILSAL